MVHGGVLFGNTLLATFWRGRLHSENVGISYDGRDSTSYYVMVPQYNSINDMDQGDVNSRWISLNRELISYHVNCSFSALETHHMNIIFPFFFTTLTKLFRFARAES